MRDDEPTPGEIEAYVAGQLDTGRKFVVETHLSRHPEQAARVMADFGAASGLKLLFAENGSGEAAKDGDTRRLASPRKLPFWRRRGAVAGLSLAGLAVIVAVFMPSGPPDYVGYAASSHRISSLRAKMHSQIETPAFDAREIASSTSISLPPLPGNWNVKDAQLFPTAKGAALVLALTTPGGRPVSLFAIRERTDAPERPNAVREGAQSVAYWRSGDMSYALTGEADPFIIDATAESLVRNAL